MGTYFLGGGLAPQKFGKAKTSKFWRDFGQLQTLIASVIGKNRAKMALLTTIVPLLTYNIW